MSDLWASVWKTDDFTTANYKDPTADEPTALQQFNTGERYLPDSVVLVLYVKAPTTATVTLDIFIYDLTLEQWVPLYSAITVTYGTVTIKNIPERARIYPRITGSANNPTGFAIGVMSGHA